ncbi:MAG: TrkA family potassium uptake protein [Clostridia bacterium]|nr:TrkA family potassium uptake protein [Clostridia bacterium]
MKSFAVIGLGRFGEAVALQLADMGYEVLAVDNDMERVNLIADKVTRAVSADAKSESVLKSLGLTNYDCVVVSIGGDVSESVLTALTLKEIGVKQLVCKARDKNHEKILQKIGADKVIIPEHEAGVKMAAKLVSGSLFDIIDLSDKYSVADIKVPSKWVSKSVSELNLRRDYGINIVAIKDGVSGNITSITPSPEYVFKDTDIVFLVGETVIINQL